MARRFAAQLVILVTMTTALPGQSPPGPGSKRYFPACAPFQDALTFDCYRSFAEVTSFLQDAVRRYPQLARLESIGKSFQGRDLWVVTITDPSTGSAADKPAIWVDGGIDSDEVIATEVALGLVHRLLVSNDARIDALRRTRTFYIAPAVIPDISELHHTTPVRPRDSTARPWDDDQDGTTDEDGPEDLDGDGEATQMRREEPGGDMVRDPRDQRLMRARRPGDAGPFYRVYVEGLDNDGDGQFGEDWVGGVDPNRNYPGNWSLADQRGAGPFPASELEIRAMLDFILAHPNIAASQHLHSSGGVILRPPSVPNMRLPASDLRLYLDLARRGLEVTGYTLATSVYDWNWPAGAPNTKGGQLWRDKDGQIRGGADAGTGGAFGPEPAVPLPGADGSAYPAYGGSIDAMYELFGILAFANEVYQMADDENKDGRIDAVDQLMYNDRALGGAAFHSWTPFRHPTLGAVEIGGWRKFGHNNPLPSRLPEEVRRNVEFILMQAEQMPRLEVHGATAVRAGSDVYRVSATVRNAGYQPTELATRQARQMAVPVRATLQWPSGATLLSPKAVHDLGVMNGFAEVPIEWLVQAPSAGTVTLTVMHPKGGRARVDVPLPR